MMLDTKMNNTKTIVFETNLNTLWIDDNYLYLKHNTQDVTAKLDNNEKIISEIISAMKTYGNFYYNHATKDFILTNNYGRSLLTLRQLVYSLANDIPVNTVRTYTLKSINKDKFDCRACNLEANVPLKVTVNEDGNIALSNGRVKSAIMDYSPELFEIVSSRKWYYHRQSNFFFTYSRIDKTKIRLHHICYCVYYNGKCNSDNIDEIVGEFKKHLKNNSLTVDHKNNLRYDNLKNNLELMSRSLNARKSNITTRLKPNQFYYPLADGECAGRIEIQNGIVGTIFRGIFGIPSFDISLLPKGEQDVRIRNLCNMVRKDIMPTDAYCLKTSWLIYGIGACFLYKLGKNKTVRD